MNFRIEPAGSAGRIERKAGRWLAIAAGAALFALPADALAQKGKPAAEELDLDQPAADANKPAAADATTGAAAGG